MPREAQDPTIEKLNDHPAADTVETHPAYAQIVLTHPVGGGKVLYGSDFRHNRWVTIHIHRSKLHRGLSHDWTHAKEELIEVSMSMSQWARFVSSAGDGCGTQCTIEAINNKVVPNITSPKDRTKQFGEEVHERLATVKETLRKLSESVNDAKLSQAAKKELQGIISNISMNLGSNLDFVAETFSKHMEKAKEQAKTEVHAYIQQSIQRAGLIGNAQSPLEIEDSSAQEEIK